jgi:hypothetical protein
MALQLIDFIGTHFQKNRLLTQSDAGADAGNRAAQREALGLVFAIL